MKRDECHLKGASQAEWFFTKAKVAAAVIKNKPSGMSGREHAEDLARRLKGREDSWEERARGLQQEVLRLRQELLIIRVTSNRRSSTQAAGHDDPMDNASQDLFSPGSEACSTDLQPGCDSGTPELLQQDPQPAIPPPDPPAPSSPRGGKSVIPHAQFLQSLCALHRVKESDRGLESLWFSPEGGTGSVLAESVCQLLDSVVAACRDPPPLGTGDPVPQACRVAARAMDLFCSQRLPSVEFTGHVEESLREMTALLLHRDQLSKLQSSEKLIEYLITLGSSSMATSFLIRHLLSLISALADQLRQSFQGQDGAALDQFPVVQYQNSCSLFWIVEQLLQNSKVPCRLEAGSDQTGFLGHLEHVFLLSEEFPVFFICMWRLGCLLTSSADQSPQEQGAGLPPTPF
ncbi:meiosis-specific protein MEI4 [Cyclopterus lumpus]|uniref:meiosis-specific protein MEI4 n=1 Tax=Cyclopterus lumpus TaxID=8103 RepID=UPI0014867451|nr:meiosis-specific protein MEI4 [Cyclopterus lumpus]